MDDYRFYLLPHNVLDIVERRPQYQNCLFHLQQNILKLDFMCNQSSVGISEQYYSYTPLPNTANYVLRMRTWQRFSRLNWFKFTKTLRNIAEILLMLFLLILSLL